jgi:hypothetical protein
MFSRRELKRTIGAVIVLIGFGLLIGIAGSDDIGHGAILPLMLKGIGCLAVMGVGAKMVGGEPDEDTL